MRTKLVSGLAALVATGLATLGVAAPSPAQAAGPSFGIASSLTVVRPTSGIAGMPTTANLTASRNETESFQIVLPGPITVNSVSGNLFGWSRTDIYSERAYNATSASDREGGTGLWYDALVPTVDRIYGEARSAFPMTATSGGNVAVWVDVSVPSSAVAGNYSGTLTVNTSAGVATIQVNMRVLGATLPVTSSLPSAFFMNYNSGSDDQICLAHTGTANCNGSATTRRSLYSLYSRLALDNRITIANGSGLRGDQSPLDYGADWETYAEGPTILARTTEPAGAKWLLPGARATSVMTYEYADWHCDSTCVGRWKAEANEPGQNFSSLVSYYACDEPGTSATTWASCAAKSKQALAAWPRPTLATSTISQYNQYGVPNGMPAVTTLSPYIAFMDNKAGQPYAGDQRASYNTFLATPGNKLWLYTSCMAAACGSPGAADYDPVYDGWPSYAIDAPANQARAMSWMIRRYKASGELNWSAQVKLASAWQAGGLYWDGMNGDGTLFYPGTPAKIGGTHDIPLPSIRLKRLRDGREDYELMKWLTDRGQGAAVDSIVSTVYPHAYSATASVDDTPGVAGPLSSARKSLNGLVEQLGTDKRVAFASNRTGNYEIFTMAADGSGTTQLTNSTAADRFPAWRPGGTSLAWTSGNDVWTMKSDGTSKVNLTGDIADVAQRPAWSANGAQIVFVRRVAGHWELWRMNADGSAKTALVGYGATGVDNYDPVVRAATVYFTSGGRLMTVPLAGGTPTALLNAGAVDEVADVGDTRMTFSRSVANQPYDIMVGSLTGTALRNLTATATGGAAVNDLHSTLSPDETQVAFASDNGGDLEIWRIGTDGQGATQLTNNAAADTDPDWAGY